MVYELELDGVNVRCILTGEQGEKKVLERESVVEFSDPERGIVTIRDMLACVEDYLDGECHPVRQIIPWHGTIEHYWILAE